MGQQENSPSIFLSYCSVAPLHQVALAAMQEFEQVHHSQGLEGLMPFFQKMRPLFSQAFAALFNAQPADIAATHSTAAACNMLAADLTLEAGDEILLYQHEYPSNYFPWKIAADRSGARLRVIPDDESQPGFRLETLASHMNEQTRVLALSHVQFSSGFSCQLTEIAKLCREREVDFILDATQSAGALAIDVEALGLSALIASGWKWFMGPHGIAVLYTSEAFRKKLGYSHGGPSMMTQGYEDLLDHSWSPHSDARRFEYSTVSGACAYAFARLIEQVFLKETMPTIEAQLRAHHELFEDTLDPNRYSVLKHPDSAFSPILGFIPKRGTPAEVCEAMQKQGVFLTQRGGAVRFAPHFLTTTEQIHAAVELLNAR